MAEVACTAVSAMAPDEEKVSMGSRVTRGEDARERVWLVPSGVGRVYVLQEKERIMSLPQLQNLMKRDPEARSCPIQA